MLRTPVGLMGPWLRQAGGALCARLSTHPSLAHRRVWVSVAPSGPWRVALVGPWFVGPLLVGPFLLGPFLQSSFEFF